MLIDIAVKDTPAMCAHIDTSVFFRISRNLQDHAPPVPGIINANPGFTSVIRAENAIFAPDSSGQKQGREISFWRGFTKTKGVDLAHLIHLCKPEVSAVATV